MTILYSSLAGLYHEMYQQIFDYAREFEFYDRLLKNNHCRKILEIGCGTGILAEYFISAGYDYLGLDLSTDMLGIARDFNHADCFMEGDMRRLSFPTPFDAVLITGRSLAYITDNQGIIDTFRGVWNSLSDGGLFVFGAFEADAIFTKMEDTELDFHLSNKTVRRISRLKKNLLTGWTWDWHARYLIEEQGKLTEYEDHTTLRAFTKDETALFLKLTGFEITGFTEESKAFTVICHKRPASLPV